MKILIATPLFPPELGESAFYIKELAKRLSTKHKITIILYGRLPEKIPNVSFVCINKQLPLIIRLLLFTLSLLKYAVRTDIIYSENGASAELPVWLVSFITRKPLVLHLGDSLYENNINRKKLRQFIRVLISKRANAIINHKPLPRPEIIPFKPYPEKEFNEYEKSWEEHIKILEKEFSKI